MREERRYVIFGKFALDDLKVLVVVNVLEDAVDMLITALIGAALGFDGLWDLDESFIGTAVSWLRHPVLLLEIFEFLQEVLTT